MVVVAQLVEPWFVVPVVAGSSPVDHPIFFCLYAQPYPAHLISKMRAMPGLSATGTPAVITS